MLGVPTVETNTVDLLVVLKQLMCSSKVLIQMYRKQLKEVSNIHLKNSQQEVLRLKLNVRMRTERIILIFKTSYD